MEVKRGNGWYLVAAIAGSCWLQFATLLAALHADKAWPTALVFTTITIYIAIAGSISLSNVWIVGAYWFACCFIAGLGLRQILNDDFRRAPRSDF